MKLKFCGGEGQYVNGYPRRDIEVQDAAEVERLVATGCYAPLEHKSKARKEVSDE